LAFLGSRPFGGENPRFWGLEKLGFPWILSSQSSLFNGLRWIFAERNFSRPFAAGGQRRMDAGIRGAQKCRIFHGTCLAQFPVFSNIIPLNFYRSAADGRVSSECAA
jgi:hypothetical protein